MKKETQLRRQMVDEQICGRGIVDKRIVSAFLQVPRHRFIPNVDFADAYEDRPVPIGNGQTISQPYIVALMCTVAEIESDDRVLEIGTGSGYAAAIISLLASEVYTVERAKTLHERSRRILEDLGYGNVYPILGDGYEGFAAQAPYDVIVLSAAPPQLPKLLIGQLAEGGRLVAPVGASVQHLIKLHSTEGGLKRSVHGAVRFVPMNHGFS